MLSYNTLYFITEKKMASARLDTTPFQMYRMRHFLLFSEGTEHVKFEVSIWDKYYKYKGSVIKIMISGNTFNDSLIF